MSLVRLKQITADDKSAVFRDSLNLVASDPTYPCSDFRQKKLALL